MPEPPLSRQALVQWINSTLALDIKKIDELGTGAAYCQVVDSIYGDVPMARVKFTARADSDYHANFKLLQAAFNRHKIERVIDIPALTKCKLQDNLEFCQWIYRFWLSSDVRVPNYDPKARRRGTGGGPLATAPSASAASATSSSALRRQQSGTRSGVSSRQSTAGTTSRQSASSRLGAHSSSSRQSVAGSMPSGPPPGVRDQRVSELEAQIDSLMQEVQVSNSERQLYYCKLLEMEELIRKEIDDMYENDKDAGMANTPVMQLIRNMQAILYATAEGFEVPAQEEEEEF